MTVYEYDGTFQGFLPVLFQALVSGMPPDDIAASTSGQPGLFAPRARVPADEEKGLRVGGMLQEKIGPEIIENIFHAFLSDAPQREMMIYRYCLLGLEVGKSLDSFLADERVIRVHRLISRVTTEAHRYLGLIRFRELEDHTLYAQMEPDTFILPLIAGHFRKRLPGRTWIIHDRRRGKAAVSTGRGLALADIETRSEPILSPVEPELQGAWKAYFTHMAIQERLNPKLQRQHISLRYWKHLIEMQSAPP